MVDSSETGIAPEKRARWCGVRMWLEVAQPFYLDLDIILAFLTIVDLFDFLSSVSLSPVLGV